MNGTFAANRRPVGALLGDLAKGMREEESARAETAKRERRQLLQRTAMLLRHQWKVRRILEDLQRQGMLPDQALQGIRVAYLNCDDLAGKLQLELVVEEKTPWRDAMGRYFEIVTSLPNPDSKVEVMMADKVIEPAVLWKGDVLIPGAIQVLQPAQPGAPGGTQATEGQNTEGET